MKANFDLKALEYSFKALSGARPELFIVIDKNSTFKWTLAVNHIITMEFKESGHVNTCTWTIKEIELTKNHVYITAKLNEKFAKVNIETLKMLSNGVIYFNMKE